MSWNDMGLDESWRSYNDAPPTPPPTKEEESAAQVRAAELGAEMRLARAAHQAALDAESGKSLAHKAKAEEEFGDYPSNAAEVASNGWSKFLVRGFMDGSVLVFQVGEMGIEEVVAFTTHADAVAWGNTVGVFE